MDQFEADKMVQFRSEWVVQLEPDLMDHCNRILQKNKETANKSLPIIKQTIFFLSTVETLGYFP